MWGANTGQIRLFQQGISAPRFEKPAEAVAYLGAVQAQDYSGALWSIGLRTTNPRLPDVEQAIIDRLIVRTWPMRGTLHFVAAADARWMLKLLTPRVISATASRQRQLEIDEGVLALARKIFVKALEGGRQFTRQEMYNVLEMGGISPAGQRGIHIIGRLAQESLLCLGPHKGRQPTFVLLDEWLPPGRLPEREEALADLAGRYFISHGPATLADFERWAGLKTSDARTGLEQVKSKLRQENLDGKTYWTAEGEKSMPSGGVYLLPGFDEFILGYKDRGAVLDPQYAGRIVPGNNGVFLPTLISAGRVIGTWKRLVKKNRVKLTPLLFDPSTFPEKEYLTTAAKQYEKFLDMPVELNWDKEF